MKRENRTFKFTVAALILSLVWILIAPLLASYLIVEKRLDKADAIFVLGGAATYLERNQRAAALYKQGIAPKIFLTNDGMRGGWDTRAQGNPYFAERARRELIAQGVPENVIEILPGIVNGTDDEARLFVETARQKSLKSVLLVTSAYHTRRAARTFEKISAESNLEIEIGIEYAPLGEQTPPPFYWWLSLIGWKLVAGEYVKSFYYWLYY